MAFVFNPFTGNLDSVGIQGTLTTNTIPKATGASTIGDSQLTENANGDTIGKDFIRTRNGTITRSGGYISSVTLTGGRTLTVTRDGSNLISSINDGTRTWTFTRSSGLISSWTIT